MRLRYLRKLSQNLPQIRIVPPPMDQMISQRARQKKIVCTTDKTNHVNSSAFDCVRILKKAKRSASCLCASLTMMLFVEIMMKHSPILPNVQVACYATQRHLISHAKGTQSNFTNYLAIFMNTIFQTLPPTVLETP